MSVKLEAGDTIYVPEDVQSFVKLERAKDIATIVAQSAMTLGRNRIAGIADVTGGGVEA